MHLKIEKQLILIKEKYMISAYMEAQYRHLGFILVAVCCIGLQPFS